ncbi:hypothetical protein ACI7RC_20035 [Brevibacillus sp. B_LB10_24]|uniref:hypothetical protein n=1 Tax=Brevibacillus sp. B_LB10_24 TaxID=3380645 RepID=UPI0038BBBA18
MIAKRILVMIGLIPIMTFNFLGLEYFLYSIYITNSKMFYLFFMLFLAVFALLGDALNRFGWYGNLSNRLMVFISVFLGMGALKMLLTYGVIADPSAVASTLTLHLQQIFNP